MEEGKLYKSELGVPQGGIVSPVLSNVVLHELDKFVTGLIEKYEAFGKGLKPFLPNPAYVKVMSAIHNINRTEKR